MSEKIVSMTNQYKIKLCDRCAREQSSDVQIRKCELCDKDVCSKCSVATDFEYLSSGLWLGDYPDFFCKVCWDKGEQYRSSIRRYREGVEESISEWRSVCID